MKRKEVVPGALAVVKKLNSPIGKEPFTLDGHLMLFGKSRSGYPIGDEFEILSKPKRNRDGINLVKVRHVSDGDTGEMFYCDVISCLEMK